MLDYLSYTPEKHQRFRFFNRSINIKELKSYFTFQGMEPKDVLSLKEICTVMYDETTNRKGETIETSCCTETYKMLNQYKLTKAEVKKMMKSKEREVEISYKKSALIKN